MVKAVVVPYMEYGRKKGWVCVKSIGAPYKKLLTLPDDEQERNLKLRQFFSETFEIKIGSVEVKPGLDCGDYDVTAVGQYHHLFVTIVEE